MNTKDNKSIIQFTNPELVESIFIDNPNYDGQLDIHQNMKITSAHDKVFSNGKNKRSSTVSLTVSNFNQIDFSTNRPFFLRITMRAKFTWYSGLNDKEEENFLKVNAASLLLSYIRPHVCKHRITTRLYFQFEVSYTDYQKFS